MSFEPPAPPSSDGVRQETELGSSVKVSRNASGKVQLEVKVRSGDDPVAVEAASALASRIYDVLDAKYGRAG